MRNPKILQTLFSLWRHLTLKRRKHFWFLFLVMVLASFAEIRPPLFFHDSFFLSFFISFSFPLSLSFLCFFSIFNFLAMHSFIPSGPCLFIVPHRWLWGRPFFPPPASRQKITRCIQKVTQIA